MKKLLILFLFFFGGVGGQASAHADVDAGKLQNTEQLIEFWQRALKKKAVNPKATPEWVAGQIRFKTGDGTIQFIREHTQKVLDDPKPFKLSLSKAYQVEKFSPEDIAFIEGKINANKKLIATDLLQKINANVGKYTFKDLVDYSTTFVSQIADSKAQATALQYQLDFRLRQMSNPAVKSMNPEEMVVDAIKKATDAQKGLMKQTLNSFPYFIRYPDHTALDFEDFNLKTGLPIYPLGVIPEPMVADGKEATVGYFYFHDISHTHSPAEAFTAQLEVHHGEYGKPQIVTPETLNATVGNAMKLNRDMRKLVKSMNELDPLNRQLMQALIFFIDHESVSQRVDGITQRPFSNMKELEAKLDELLGTQAKDLSTMVRRLMDENDFGASFKQFPEFKVSPEFVQKKTQEYIKFIDSIGFDGTSKAVNHCAIKNVLQLISPGHLK